MTVPDGPLAPGTVIAGVTVGERLGRGSFGITYRVRDNRTGRLYALKEYFPVAYARRTERGAVAPTASWGTAFGAGLQAFLQEARTLKDLPRQPGLVRVRGAFERSGTAYCLMEFVEGEPLDRLLAGYVQNGRTVPEPTIRTFLETILPALRAVHAHGLIHRDIKPANVMIRRSDHLPVLIDFGAARRVSAACPGTAFLTREYAAVEQFPPDTWGSDALALREGPWSDLFSLSVLLYRLVTHQLPANAEIRLREARCSADPYVPASRAAREGYSPCLLDLVDRGCALLPEDRTPSATAYLRLLRSAPDRGSAALPTAIKEGAIERAIAPGDHPDEPHVQAPAEIRCRRRRFAWLFAHAPMALAAISAAGPIGPLVGSG